MKENTFYFTHDFTAQNDEKVESMIFKLGWESYGLFWALVEKLAQDPNHKLKKEYDRISNVLRTTEKLIKSIIEDFGLFIFDLSFFWSERLNRHFEKLDEKSKKAKESINKRWGKNTIVLPSYYGRNTIKEIKEKEIKEKEILVKENISADAPQIKKNKKSFEPPTIEEIKAYIQEKDLKANPNRFFNYYESNGWRVGRNPMKDWKATLRNWRSDDKAQVMNGYVQIKSKSEKRDDMLNGLLSDIEKAKSENFRDVVVEVEKLPAEASNQNLFNGEVKL